MADVACRLRPWPSVVHILTVPSPPWSKIVCQQNPGVWLILRPAGAGQDVKWKPWGRLEAWRESFPLYNLGYRFQILPADAAPVTLTQASACVKLVHGGKFVVDGTSGVTKPDSPDGESGLGPELLYRRFVMSATVMVAVEQAFDVALGLFERGDHVA